MKGIYPGPNGLTPAATWARISRPTGRSVTDFRPLSRSLSGEKRTLRVHPISVANDPLRHFATANYRTAKGLFDHLVGAA